MKHSHQPENENKTDGKKSVYRQHKPLILGMGGGVLVGIVMGFLLNDPALGLVFGLGVGSGTWYTLSQKQP